MVLHPVEQGGETPLLAVLLSNGMSAPSAHSGAPPLGQSRPHPSILQPQSCSVTLRVEEVNWAAWEQTLPTLCEDPSGPGDPGK